MKSAEFTEGGRERGRGPRKLLEREEEIQYVSLTLEVKVKSSSD